MRIIRAIIFFGLILATVSCSENLIEEIGSTWPNGKPHEVVYYKLEKGEKLKVREERFYENGSHEMIGGYKGIKKEGEWIYWFQDGKKWSQASYKNDLKEGQATVWREDGNKNYEGSYATGKPHGTWIFYDVDGSRLKEVLFEYGKKVNEISFKTGVPFKMPSEDSVQFKVE